MSAPWKYPEELRERAKRMVAEAWEQDGSLSLHAAVNRIGPRVGVQPDTLRTWCRQADVDAGKRAGSRPRTRRRSRSSSGRSRRFCSSSADSLTLDEGLVSWQFGSLGTTAPRRSAGAKSSWCVRGQRCPCGVRSRARRGFWRGGVRGTAPSMRRARRACPSRLVGSRSAVGLRRRPRQRPELCVVPPRTGSHRCAPPPRWLSPVPAVAGGRHECLAEGVRRGDLRWRRRLSGMKLAPGVRDVKPTRGDAD